MTDLSPQQKNRLNWVRHTLKLNSINANKGSINCGHCALRLDDNLRNGSAADNMNPVPKVSAKLFSDPIFKIKNGKETNLIRSSSISDPRILDRCAHPGLSDQTLMRYDFTSDERGENPILDLTYEGQQQETEKASIRLIKVKTQDQNDLMEILRQLPRTSSKNAYLDNTAFGFIYRTHASNAKIAHITNFFVDTDDTVYFIDAQDATIRLELDLNNYQLDVFFMPSKPKDGYKIKKENIIHDYPVAIKQEPNDMTDNSMVIDSANKILDNKRKREEEQNNLIQVPELKKTRTITQSKIDVFIEQALTFAKEQNSAEINNLIKTTAYNLHVLGSSNLNAIHLLASKREVAACEFLLSYHAVSIHDCVSGAASGGHKDLAEYFLSRLEGSKRDYNRAAGYAAIGGHKDLAEYFLSKLEESKRDYNRVAGTAAQGGHKDLAEYFLSKLEESKRDYNGVAWCAAHGGHKDLVEYFLSKLEEGKRDYNGVIGNAVIAGHIDLANFYFEKAMPMELVNLRPQIQEKDLTIIQLTGQNIQKDLTITQLIGQITCYQNMMPNVNNFITQQQQQLNALQKQMQPFQPYVGPQKNITPFVNNQGPNTQLIVKKNNAPTYTPQITQLKNNVPTLAFREMLPTLEDIQQIKNVSSQPNNGQGGSISSNNNNKPF